MSTDVQPFYHYYSPLPFKAVREDRIQNAELVVKMHILMFWFVLNFMMGGITVAVSFSRDIIRKLRTGSDWIALIGLNYQADPFRAISDLPTTTISMIFCR
jgi:hypothetical protein